MQNFLMKIKVEVENLKIRFSLLKADISNKIESNLVYSFIKKGDYLNSLKSLEMIKKMYPLSLKNNINQHLVFSFMLICSVKEDESNQALSQSKVLIGAALFVVSFIVIILIIGYFNGDSPDGGGNNTATIPSMENTATIPSMENIAIEDIIPDIDTD
jgi:Na+/proline symporter